ncbi:MAG: hypothetical protein M3179_04775 [Actinomycetota bacterium]|nr:hypothetical protein [Actinomycetota bacterium]
MRADPIPATIWLVIDRLPRGALVLVVALAGACSGGDEKDSAFCRSARQSVPRMESAYATLSESAQGAGRVDLEEARGEYAASIQAVVETLDRPPEEIGTDAGATAEGLRQQLAAVSSVEPGSPPAPFPADRHTAAARVDTYLRATCEVPASVMPR